MNDRGAIETGEVIKGAAKQLHEATYPVGISKELTTEGVGFESVIKTGEVLEKAQLNEAITLLELRGYLKGTKQELSVLEKIPESVKFSLETGAAGSNKRKEQLKAILTIIGVSEVAVAGEVFTADEIWDAVCYEGRSTHVDLTHKKDEAVNLLEGDRGAIIKKHSKAILEKTGINNAENILNIATSLVVEDIDPLSLREKSLRKAFKNTLFEPHKKQKISNKAEAAVRDVMVTKKHLERWQVVNTFLTQKAEGRTGQKTEPKPGERQLPYQLSFDEKRKRITIANVPDKDVDEICEVLEQTDVMVESAQQQVLQGVQGYWGWTAETVIRRAHEIWSETSKSIQKDLSGMITHLSEVGHGHFIAAALEIPDVGKILARPDWYQQRNPLTDRPKEMPGIEDTVKNVKKWARDEHISSSKVDLAFFLTQLLQIGHWIGKVGLKHRNILERYGIEDIATGLPVGTFDKIYPIINGQVNEDMPKVNMEELTREERINLELQIRDFAATVVGTCLDWSAEHLKRLPDAALQEDVLYRMNVGEPPIYLPVNEIDKRIIQAIHEKQMLFEEVPNKPLEQTRALLQESYLHREQYRWIFVWARFGELYKGWERRTGKQAVEKQYINPNKQEDRQALIDWLHTKDFARATLAEAGINPDRITDDVIKELFTDENMIRVNEFRDLIFIQSRRKVLLSDLAEEVDKFEHSQIPATREQTNMFLATVLEFVLRDKRTWNVDMGVNNNLFSDPNLALAKEVREKSEFGANEAHLLVTAEDFRHNIHNTFGKILGNLRLIHLEAEFPDVKKYMEELTNAYGDDGRYRQGTLTGPELAMETSLSTRAGNMVAAYYLMGYEATGGDWVTSQQHLYDRFDINRIFHERFHPVVGVARRIRGINEYEAWIDNILARQRAVPSNALDTRWERNYATSPNLQEIITLTEVGGKGKGMYSHCVREIGEYGQDIGQGIVGLHLDNSRRYWEIRNERMAQKLYQPGSEMLLTSWRSSAEEGKMNREEARAQIDQYVGLGFMRRWYNDEHEKVGLGDLFQAKFETYIDYQHPEKGKRMEIFPINFMLSLQRQAYGVSVEWAMAHDYPNPAAFWYEAKQGLLNGDSQKLWVEFREMMLENWMVNVELPDSQIPTYYWEWRDSCLEMLGMKEEMLERMEQEGVYKTYITLSKSAGSNLKKFFVGEAWTQKILREHGEKFRERLEKDPVRMALTAVETAYCKFVVKEVSEELERAHGFRGMSAENKVRLREAIADHYNKGHIDRNTRDILLSKVIETRYGSGLVATVNDWKNFIVNGGINLSLYDWFFEGGVGLLGMMFKDIKKGFWYDATRAALIPSPLGWGIGILASNGIGNLVKLAALGESSNISAFTTILHKVLPFIPETAALPFTLTGILAVWIAAQTWALGATWATRGINKYIAPRLMGRRFADNDSIIQALEKTKR